MDKQRNLFDGRPRPAAGRRIRGLDIRQVALATLLLTLTTAVHAQVSPADSLPNIAPQEFEIVGTLDVSFPALERQPLSGFNFSEATTDVPDERRPFVDPRHQRIAYSPTLRFSPLPGQTRTDVTSTPSGVLELAGGRYASRLVRANYQTPLADDVLFSGHLDYFGRAGHQPYPDDLELQSSSDIAEGGLQLTYDRGGLATGVEVDGFYRAYLLYAPDARQAASAPERTGRGGGLAWFLDAATDAYSIDAELGYELTRYATDVAGTEASDVFRQERRLLGRAEATGRVSGRSVHADALVTFAGIDGESPAGDDVVSFDAGADVEVLSGEKFNMRGGARLLSYSASERAGGPADGFFVSPVVQINYYPQARLRMYAHNKPQVEPHALRGLLRLNPYLVDKPAVQPTVRFVDAAAGALLAFGDATIRGQAEWREIPNMLYFAQAENGRVAPQYAPVRILGISTDGSYNIAGRLFSTVGLAYRWGRLTDTGATIPYFSPVTARGALSYAFPKGRLSLGGRYLSPRSISQTTTEELEAYFSLDLSAEYRIFQSLALTARLRNIGLGSLERWSGYPQPGYTAMLGIEWHL